MKKPIGHILKLLRKKNNLSQNIVAEYLFVSRQTYVRYELDIVELTVSQLFLIGTFYKMNINDLLLMIDKYETKCNFDNLEQIQKNQRLIMGKSD